MNPPCHNKNSGYVLYLVLVVLFILGVLSSIVVYSLGSATQLTIVDQKKFQARLLAESGIARVEYFLNGGDNHNLAWETDSLRERIENVGDITIACKHFGAYASLVSTGVTGIVTCKISSLLGRDVPDLMKPVITVTGDLRGLIFDAKSEIQGTILLRDGDVIRTVGAEKKRMNERGVTIVLPHPSNDLPFSVAPLDSVFSKARAIAQQIQKSTPAGAPASALTKDLDSLRESQTMVVSGDYDLRKIHVQGKTLVIGGSLTIGDNAECVSCTFISKSVMINGGITGKCLFYSPEKQTIAGGKHNSQFFCEDTISVSNTAQFSGTTLWVCRKRVADQIQHGAIQFDKSGSYAGCAICYQDSLERKSNCFRGVSVSLGENSSFRGFLVSDGDITICNNHIEGQLWARNLGKGLDVGDQRQVIACSIKPLSTNMPFPLLGGTPIDVRNYEPNVSFLVRK